MAAIYAAVLSIMLYYNILTIRQLDREIYGMSTYVQKIVSAPTKENVDFERLQRANILIINGGAAGSGTVISMEDGYIYILTARHVAESDKDTDVLEIEVPMIDHNYKDTNKRHMNRVGSKYVVVDKTKDVVMCDDYDMALVRIKDFVGHELSFIPPGVKNPELGDTLYVVGNPQCFRDVISKGIYVGADDFDGTMEDRVYAGVVCGNSGGAVINTDGEIVGVIYAKLAGSVVSHIGIFVPRKPMIFFVDGAFKLFEKETTVTESNKILN